MIQNTNTANASTTDVAVKNVNWMTPRKIVGAICGIVIIICLIAYFAGPDQAEKTTAIKESVVVESQHIDSSNMKSTYSDKVKAAAIERVESGICSQGRECKEFAVTGITSKRPGRLTNYVAAYSVDVFYKYRSSNGNWVGYRDDVSVYEKSNGEFIAKGL